MAWFTIHKYLQYENIPSYISKEGYIFLRYCLVCGHNKCSDEEWENRRDPHYQVTCGRNYCIDFYLDYINKIIMDKL